MIGVLLLVGWLQSPSRVVVFDQTPVQAEALSRFLGSGYVVEHFDRSRGTTRYGAKRQPGTRDSDAVAVVCPSLADYGLGNFVVQLRSDLLSIKRYYRKAFAYVPDPTTAEERTYLVPLVRQASREAGVPLISADASTPFVEAVADAILDQRLEKKDWRLIRFDSQQIDEGPAANAIDGDPNTYWHTQYDPTEPKPPHELVVDMGKKVAVGGFRYLPRQDGGVNGRVKGYAFYLSDDGKNWGEPAIQGELTSTNKPTRLKLSHPVEARFFRFVATSEVNKGPWTTAAEIDVLRARG